MHRNHPITHIFLLLSLLFVGLLPQSAQAQPAALAASVPGFTMLKDIFPGADNGVYGASKAKLGNKVFFFANDGTHGIEPWITDGTPNGTVMVKDLNPGPANTVLDLEAGSPMVAWNGKVYFEASDGKNGFQLWVSDGTAAGTYVLRSSMGKIRHLAAFATGVVAQARIMGKGQVDIWWTDGSSTNTFILYSFRFTLPSSPPPTLSYAQLGNSLYIGEMNGILVKVDLQNRQAQVLEASGVEWVHGAANGLMFYEKYTSLYGKELWQTSGTSNSIQLVADLAPWSGNSYIYSSIVYGNALVLATNTGVYSTLGKAGGTTLLADTTGGGIYGTLQQVYGVLFFAQKTEDNIWLPWRSDGTPGGTFPMCYTCLHDGSYYDGVKSMYFAGIPGKILYTASDKEGDEFWITDGSDRGTHRLANLFSQYESPRLTNILTMDGYVFFIAYDVATGFEPWVYRPVNTFMTANHDKLLATQGIPNPINVLANDVHANGLPIQLSGFDAMSTRGGSLSRYDAGTPGNLTDDKIIYTPPSPFVPKDEFAYWIEDGSGKMTLGRVSIEVTILPLAPTDFYFVPNQLIQENQGQIVNIGSLHVIDPSAGDSHTCALSTPNPLFTVFANYFVATNDSLDYESNPNGYFVGITCTDKTGLSLTKDIHIPVHNVNEPPVMDIPVAKVIPEDSASVDWLITWTDPESHIGTLTIIQQPAHGTATITDCQGSSCMLHYQPSVNYVGTDTFSIKVFDNDYLYDQETVNVTVTEGDNDPPVMKPIYNVVRPNAVAEYHLKLEGIAAGPYEGGPVTMEVTTDNAAMLKDLAVDYTGDSEGWLSFTLHPEEGTDAVVTITLSDGVNEAQYTFHVLVTDNPPLYLPVISR